MNLSSPHRQSLSDRQRRTAFGAVAVILVGALVLIDALGGARQPAPRAAAVTLRAAPAGTPVRAGAPRIVNSASAATATTGNATTTRAAAPARSMTAPVRHTVAPQRPGITPRRRAPIPTRTVLAHARRFLSAYVVYEVRPLDAVMRAVLRRSATAALGARLLAHPVRLPTHDRPAVGTVQSLELGGDPDSITVTADATIARAGWVSGLILDFDRSGGRWLVSRVS